MSIGLVLAASIELVGEYNTFGILVAWHAVYRMQAAAGDQPDFTVIRIETSRGLLQARSDAWRQLFGVGHSRT
jgi:hypothetical protein